MIVTDGFTLQFGLTKDYLFKEMTGFHLIYSVKGNHWV